MEPVFEYFASEAQLPNCEQNSIKRVLAADMGYEQRPTF